MIPVENKPAHLRSCVPIGTSLLLWEAGEDPIIRAVTYRPHANVSDIRQLREHLDAARAPIMAQPFCALVDVSAYVGEDLGPLHEYVRQIFHQHVGPHFEAYQRLIHAQVLIRRQGMAAAICEFFRYTSDAPWYVADDLEQGLAWLGYTMTDALWTEVAASSVHLETQTALTQLAQDGKKPTLALVARKLGVSERTLQRKLTAANVSFRDEVLRSRVEHAKQLLLTTDLKLDAIARAVGYGFSQSLVRAFRQATGESPSAWARSHRAD